MANTLNINIVSTEKATGPIKKTTRAVRDLGKETERVGKKSSKDFSQFGDLFSSLLPRGLQSTVRGFKGAQRQIGRLSKSFTVLKGAIAATGLGLLVVALGELVANWDAISGSISSATDETKEQVKYGQELVATSKEQLDNISAQENILKLQGKTEEEILAMRMSATDEAIAAQRIMLEALKSQKTEQAAAAQQASDVVAGLLMFVSAPVAAVLASIDLISEGLVRIGVLAEKTNLATGLYTGIGDLLFDPKGVEESGEDAVKKAEEQLLKLENQRAGYQLRANDNAQKAEDDAQRVRDKNAAKREADAEFRAAKLLAIQRDLELRGIEDEEARAKRKRELQYEDAKAELDAREAGYGELLALQRQYEMDTADLTEQFRIKREEQATRDAQKAKADAQKEKDAALKADQDIVRGKQEALSLQEQNVMNTLDTIQSLNTLFTKKGEKDSKQAFDRQKKLSIAEALISTYFSAQKAYTSQFMPVPTDPTAPIRGTLAAAAAVASGLVRVKQIKNQEYNGGSTGGGGGGGGAGRSGFGPSPNIQTPLPARLDTPDSMQAYVVQSQLQGQMAMASKLQEQTVL